MVACFSFQFFSKGGKIMEKRARVKAVANTSMVSGVWKFVNVNLETLLDLIEEWNEAERDKYIDLHVRKCSKGQIAVGFKYLFEGDDHKKFFHKVTDQLKRRFGNDFIGYDISSPTWLIPKEKQVEIVVTHVINDFQAHQKDRPGLYWHGESMLEALGNFVLANSKMFKVTQD